jgi:hypothetical protein
MPATLFPHLFFFISYLAITGVTGVLSKKHLQNLLGPASAARRRGWHVLYHFCYFVNRVFGPLL